MDSVHSGVSHDDGVEGYPGFRENVKPRLELVREVSFYEARGKRFIDVVGAAVLLVLLTPFILLTALLVRVSLGSPVVYRQERIGKNGELFELYKFRTMIPDRRNGSARYAGPERRHVHKAPRDPRVRPTGRLLRAIRFDELPQLWNVVKGDMSLVGPRPELPEIVAEYENWQHRRHTVKPGLSGLWQVSASNGAPMHECTEVDLEYVENVSLRQDMKILLQTPGAMFHRRGY